MKKRVNPRRVPATRADIKRAKDIATAEGLKRALYMVLYVLIDKHGGTKEEIDQLAKEINHCAACVVEGYIDWKDIEHLVVDEFGVRLPW